MVQLGIDRITEYAKLFSGKRIALITNYSGISSALRDSLSVFLESGFRVTKLFTPEHGMWGAMDGAKVGDALHPKWKIPMISLYGEKRRPAKADLADTDLLVYDIQDVGLRYYTYIYTLAECMAAAAEAGLPLAVLDRPDPLGDTLSGCRIDPRFDSFVGAHALLTRYGLTCGEIARYFRARLCPGLSLSVVPMAGYRRNMKWPETGQLWNLPSPSIHTFHTALCYVGGCFFEATNISEGRGTAEPFQIFGAPFVDMDRLVKELRARLSEPRVAFRERAFTPFWSKWAGQACFGVEFIPLSDDLDFMLPALTVLKTFLDLYPDKMEFRSYADVSRLSSLSGDESVGGYLAGKVSLAALDEAWRAQQLEFARETESLRLYR